MYLMYVDESGDASSAHFTAAAVLVHEQDISECAGRLQACLRELGPGWELAEYHAQHVRSGKGPWRRVRVAERLRLNAEIAGRLARNFTSGRGAVLFAVTIERAAFPGIDPVERAYEELFLRVDSFLGRLHAAGDSHRCVAISDETRLEPRLQQLMTAWRTSRGRVRRLSAFVEVPLFADSRASRMLQLADFAAHWTYRAYEADDTLVRDQLLPRFDTDRGRIHGLVHLRASRATCPCPACASRRGT